MKDTLKNLVAPEGSFLHQLTVSFTIGIITLILVASVVTSWLASNRTESSLIKQGHQITENLARQSALALLYGEGENAKDAARGALAFPDVMNVYIYDTSFRLILHEGKNFEKDIIYFSPLMSSSALIFDGEEHWRFRAPVYSQVVQDNEFVVLGANTKPELLGYADVVLSKDTLVDTTTSIFVVNSIIFFLLAAILLLVLRFMAKRITQPLNKLSNTMYNAESSVENAYADEDGPQEAKVIAHAFNQMIKAINERDKELKNQNITLEKRVRNRTMELAEARDKAIEASKTKSRFLANMSHELRTPLNAIIGYSELLMEDAIDKNNKSSYGDLHKVNNAGVHLLSLINNILDLSKIEAGKIDLYLEAFTVGTMVSDVQSVIEPLAKKNNNTFRVDCPESVGSMCSDETKIRQSLLNLISNACKFTKDGEVTLVVRPHKLGNHEGISFCVSDQGIGMTKNQVNNLFREFTQADSSTTREYGGTGLGLAISKHFCEMMGGYISVESVKDEGSVFTMFLPRVATVDSVTPPGENAQKPDGREKTESKVVVPDANEMQQRSM
ncbi:MAG: HAMP domain-containing histidine kinase [Gammaproteobacteria bacterium]|nr:HAMP domain-containing histidine kinase [Gammaproteobacteria bacterium]